MSKDVIEKELLNSENKINVLIHQIENTINYLKTDTVDHENTIWNKILINSSNKTNDTRDLLIFYSLCDSQVDNSGILANFTDFQNVALANFSYFELFFKNGEDLSNMTISEIFSKYLNGDYTLDDFLNFDFDCSKLLGLEDEDNVLKYRGLFLGNLLLYGFGDLTIDEMVRGKDGFNATVFHDKSNEYMVHFSCTDPYDINDILYDAYPILGKDLGIIGSAYADAMGMVGIGPKAVFDSQRQQAVELLGKYLGLGKTSVSGYSLGGNLAEYAYSAFIGNSNINGLVLFNSYHSDSLNGEQLKTLYDKGLLKVYAAEGDMVSTIHNYDLYSKYTKPIYIDYQSAVAGARSLSESELNLLNQVLNNHKADVLTSVRDSCYYLSDTLPSTILIPSTVLLDVALRELGNLVNTGIENNWDFQQVLSMASNLPLKEVADILIQPGYDLTLLNHLEDTELLFSGIHLVNSVETNRNNAFDENGNVRTSVDDHNVHYLTFNQMSDYLFNGIEPYTRYVSDYPTSSGGHNIVTSVMQDK